MKTSITDTNEYRDFCKSVVENTELFEQFRNDPSYCVIVENVTREQGAAYLYYIKKHMKDFDLYRDKFQLSDKIGNPKLEDYGEDGIWSPTTLRYVKVLAEINEYFGPLEDFAIVEIGGGYGGQYKIINDYSKIEYYDIYDLKETNMLISKFLSYFELSSLLSEELSLPSSFDLVISNYAFSEISYDMQKKYMSYVFDNCNRGYITYNNISNAHNIDSITSEEFKDYVKLRGGFCIEEFPKTNEDNFIAIWGCNGH